tara:strand:- start:237 stop:563 length:327 start_codon:yes stop_codon:yes gene_type:complete
LVLAVLAVLHLRVEMVVIQFLVPLLPQVVEAVDMMAAKAVGTAVLAAVPLAQEALVKESVVKEMMVVLVLWVRQLILVAAVAVKVQSVSQLVQVLLAVLVVLVKQMIL